jgi:hypothetical protein
VAYAFLRKTVFKVMQVLAMVFLTRRAAPKSRRALLDFGDVLH